MNDIVSGRVSAEVDFSTCPVRMARPTRDLDAARRFWVDGLGLDVLWQTGPEAEGGHALLMVGAPDAQWHLELVGAAEAHAETQPGPEDLLVLYCGSDRGSEIDPALVDRLLRCGGTRVGSPNPFWERWGVTIADPDGYRLVLCSRSWP